jgi:hypothetical protein
LLLVLLPVLSVGRVVESFLLGYAVFVVHFSVPALVGDPIVGQRRFETFSGQVQQILVLGQSHSESFNGVFFDLSIGGFIGLVDLLDHRFGFVVIVFVVLLVEMGLVGRELAVGIEGSLILAWAIHAGWDLNITIMSNF